MILSPSDDIARALHSLKSGAPGAPTVVLFKPGDYHGGGVISGVAYVQVAAQGKVRFTDSGSRPYALKFDHCQHISAQGLGATDSAGHSFMATNCAWLTWEDLWSENAHTNGFLTGGCTQVTWRGLRADNSRGGHGGYLSEAGSDYLVDSCQFRNSGRCALQINSHPGHSQRVKVVSCDLRVAGNCNLQLAGITGGTIANNQIGGARQEIVVWEDGGGRAYACSGIDLSGQDGKVKVHPFCKDIKTRPGARVPWTN